MVKLYKKARPFKKAKTKHLPPLNHTAKVDETYGEKRL